MSLTKERIIEDVYARGGLSKAQSRGAVESLFEILKQTLEKGEDLLVSGFGKFLVKQKAPRRGRNPQTTEDIHLRARKVVIFRTSGVLRKRIKEGPTS